MIRVSYQVLSIVVTVVVFMVIPLVGTIIRNAMRWQKIESKVDEIVNDLKSIVSDKDKVHTEMLAQIRDDRKATDRRLRWLEEHLWKGSGA